MPKTLFNSINKINQSLCLKKDYVVLPYTKQILFFIVMLYNQNYIEKFYYNKNNKIFCVFKKNQGKFVFTKIETTFNKGQKKVSKVSALWGAPSTFGALFLSTPFGFITDKMAIKINTAGVVFCSIVLFCIMIKKFFFSNDKFFFLTTFFNNYRFFFSFYNKKLAQKQFFPLPQIVFFFFTSKTSFIFFSPKNLTKSLRFFFEKLSFVIKKQFFFIEQTFLFKIFLKGIGYKFELFYPFIKINIGFSHPIFLFIPGNISVKNIDTQTLLFISSNKQALGQVAARMRFFSKPDVYKQKGLFFFNLSKEKNTKQVSIKTSTKKK